MSELQPLADRVALKIVEVESKSPIVVPEQYKTRSQVAEVVAVGRGRVPDGHAMPIPLEVKVGDRVLVGKNAGAIIEVEGESVYLVREVEILARLTTPAPKALTPKP